MAVVSLDIAEQIVFPRSRRGRRSVAAQERHEADLAAFCAGLLEIKSRLDFEVSARGWGYLLENAGSHHQGRTRRLRARDQRMPEVR